MVDFIGDEAAILADIRKLITVLPANNEEDMSYEECTDDLNRVCSDLANCAETQHWHYPESPMATSS